MKSIFWPNLLAGALYKVARVTSKISGTGLRGRAVPNFTDGILGIEAGEEGWNHIFFKEAFGSATDFLGVNHVAKLAVKRNQSYVRQVRDFVDSNGVTHYFYDPRTGSQLFFTALLQSFRLAVLFSRRGIIPIAYCTDISVRRWRIQAAIVTSLSGLCVCLTREDIAKGMFPHNRLIGPALMPLSDATLELLDALRSKKAPGDVLQVSFFGSLYEPRVTQLEEIRKGLEAAGITFHIRGRAPGGERISDHDYWEALISSDILISTSSQVNTNGMDLADVNHLIYRFCEALACGVCLVIEDAPGVERYFTDSTDLVLWKDAEEAVKKVRELAAKPDQISKIAKQGRDTMIRLVSARHFWVSIMNALDESRPQKTA